MSLKARTVNAQFETGNASEATISPVDAFNVTPCGITGAFLSMSMLGPTTRAKLLMYSPDRCSSSTILDFGKKSAIVWSCAAVSSGVSLRTLLCIVAGLLDVSRSRDCIAFSTFSAVCRACIACCQSCLASLKVAFRMDLNSTAFCVTSWPAVDAVVFSVVCCLSLCFHSPECGERSVSLPILVFYDSKSWLVSRVAERA